MTDTKPIDDKALDRMSVAPGDPKDAEHSQHPGQDAGSDKSIAKRLEEIRKTRRPSSTLGSTNRWTPPTRPRRHSPPIARSPQPRRATAKKPSASRTRERLLQRRNDMLRKCRTP